MESTSDTSGDKSALRRSFRDQAAAMSPEERERASEQACARMLATPWFATSQVIMLYAPTEHELDVTLLARECGRTGRRVVVPRIRWEEKELDPAMVHHWQSGWVTGRYGIREPGPDAMRVSPGEVDLIVVPGLAFDRHRMRLGRGAGFYDRLLARAEVRATKIGIGFDWQLVRELPTSDHDQRLDAVVVESEVV